MSDDPSDVDLDRPLAPDPGRRPTRSPAPVVLWAVLGILLLAVVAGYLFLRRGASQPDASAAAVKPAPTPRAEPGELTALPPLDETDAIVRELVSRLSSHPTVAAWLATDGLIVNFVVVTSRIANGETPVAELKAVGPVPRFRTRTSRDIAYIDPSSYRRYDRHAEAVSAIDARGAAQLYATLKPRIADAYRRMGHPDGNFDPVLERAIIELLRVPAIDGEVALEPHGIVYAFAEPRLQSMTAAQKQLLRMGPQNVRAVQAKLREIASHLGIPASRLPPPVTK
jgi:hypothetical protein